MLIRNFFHAFTTCKAPFSRKSDVRIRTCQGQPPFWWNSAKSANRVYLQPPKVFWVSTRTFLTGLPGFSVNVINGATDLLFSQGLGSQQWIISERELLKTLKSSCPNLNPFFWRSNAFKRAKSCKADSRLLSRLLLVRDCFSPTFLVSKANFFQARRHFGWCKYALIYIELFSI